MDSTSTLSGPELTYLKGEVEVASGVKLMVSLHNRLLRNLTEARDALNAVDDDSLPVAPPVSAGLQRCREILTVLIATITDDDEVGTRMLTVYYTAMEQILAAEMEKKGARLDGILPSIEILRDRWVELLAEEKAGNS